MVHPTKCRVSENSRVRQGSLLQGKMQRNRRYNRKGKTRDLFKKIGNIKGLFHPKMGTIKERMSKDLIEAEETKKS